MSRLRLYIDEDAMQTGLVQALRLHKLDAITAFDARMINEADEEHLAFASRSGRVLYSFNIADYCILNAD